MRILTRILAGDTVLCSNGQDNLLSQCLSTQVYKWVLVNLMLGVALQGTSVPSRGEGE